MKLPCGIQATATALLSRLLVSGRSLRKPVKLQLNGALYIFTEFPSLILDKPFNCHFPSMPNSPFKPNKPCFRLLQK